MDFLIPVRYTGIRYHRVSEETYEAAIAKVKNEADIKANFELNLASPKFEVLAPCLMLPEEQKATWKYWEYWYTGTDGVDWRVGYTKDGKESIPDFAEEMYPVPADWLDSWKDDGNEKS